MAGRCLKEAGCAVVRQGDSRKLQIRVVCQLELGHSLHQDAGHVSAHPGKVVGQVKDLDLGVDMGVLWVEDHGTVAASLLYEMVQCGVLGKVGAKQCVDVKVQPLLCIVMQVAHRCQHRRHGYVFKDEFSAKGVGIGPLLVVVDVGCYARQDQLVHNCVFRWSSYCARLLVDACRLPCFTSSTWLFSIAFHFFDSTW